MMIVSKKLATVDNEGGQQSGSTEKHFVGSDGEQISYLKLYLIAFGGVRNSTHFGISLNLN